MSILVNSTKSLKSACILCSRNCGIEIDIEHNQFIKIKGDPDHPETKGYICQKAARLNYYQNHDDRLTEPLKRQPDGSFSPISWDQALQEISHKLLDVRTKHGGNAFAFVGGGGQGNHLGGAYSRQLLAAMKSYFSYNALGQEKTGDFWLNGRLFGDQRCHTTEDVTHSDYLIVIGSNPFQSHGIANARETLRAFRKDPSRTLVVIDPRKTETVDYADIHLQLNPSTDAYLMLAILAIIVKEERQNKTFLKQHTHGSEQIIALLKEIPVESYVKKTGVELELVTKVARDFAQARAGCIRVDLGIQHSKNTTLNGYLEKLLYLLTGHFGKKGTNNLHTALLPILGNTDERNPKYRRTAYHKMFPIAAVYPPNILPDEILKAGDNRIRAIFVDSANPLMNFADTAAYTKAFRSLELLVVVDVAMTETAREAHYVLPASSQFEKCEMTGFNLEFPKNFTHLRQPLLQPKNNTLPEPEIYTRLLEQMGILPKRYPLLQNALTLTKKLNSEKQFFAFLAAFAAFIATNQKLMPFAPSILYRTLGHTLPKGMAAAVPLSALCMVYAAKYYQAVKRTGLKGNRFNLGYRLFQSVINAPSGTLISQHHYDEMWTLMGYKDRIIRLAIPEMLDAINQLEQQTDEFVDDFPLILAAGERRSYNANQIFRDPKWRKTDLDGHLRIHPDDAAKLDIKSGQHVQCISQYGKIVIKSEIDATVLPGVVTIPHGYGNIYEKEIVGPAINQLTGLDNCEAFTRIPYHKHVRVKLLPII